MKRCVSHLLLPGHIGLLSTFTGRAEQLQVLDGNGDNNSDDDDYVPAELDDDEDDINEDTAVYLEKLENGVSPWMEETVDQRGEGW